VKREFEYECKTSVRQDKTGHDRAESTHILDDTLNLPEAAGEHGLKIAAPAKQLLVGVDSPWRLTFSAVFESVSPRPRRGDDELDVRVDYGGFSISLSRELSTTSGPYMSRDEYRCSYLRSSSNNDPTALTKSLGTTFFTPPAAVVPPATPPLAPSPPLQALSPPPLPTVRFPTLVVAPSQLLFGGNPIPNQYPAGGWGCAWIVQMMTKLSEASTLGLRKS
jgi:hypothetical protein